MTSPKDFSTIKEFFTRYWCSGDGSYKVLDAALVRLSQAYAAVQRTTDKGTEVFAATFMMHFTGDEYSYKSMSEHDGPWMTECPERIMKLLTPLKDGENYAKRWREEVWNRINNHKKCLKVWRKTKLGDIIITKENYSFGNNGSFNTFVLYNKKRLLLIQKELKANYYGPIFRIHDKSMFIDNIKQVLTPQDEEYADAVSRLGLKKYVFPKYRDKEYPQFKSPNGYTYRCLGWAISLKNGWEWYALEHVEGSIFFGFVHGFEDEYGNFDVEELQSNGIKFVDDYKELHQIWPPIGWEKITEEEKV